MVRTVAIIAVSLVIAALTGLWIVSRGGNEDQFAQCRQGQVAGGTAAIGGPFELVSETGKTVTDEDVLTEPSLIYFGYTFCPDVCPMDASRNAEAVDLLEGQGRIVQPVFISIDPARDTPEVLAEFTDYLHPRMLGLTGSAAQIKAPFEQPDGATATWVSGGLEELVQALLAACLCPVPSKVVTDRHGDFKDLAVAHGRVILCSGSQGNQKAHRVR